MVLDWWVPCYPVMLVITSYSIHYTKLYDGSIAPLKPLRSGVRLGSVDKSPFHVGKIAYINSSNIAKKARIAVAPAITTPTMPAMSYNFV